MPCKSVQICKSLFILILMNDNHSRLHQKNCESLFKCLASLSKCMQVYFFFEKQ